ncbi:hypothetical protein L0F63_001247 [Massospora cicadina]|nr:hypothetical protein L0F63_001247 [Massospora cicadina]
MLRLVFVDAFEVEGENSQDVSISREGVKSAARAIYDARTTGPPFNFEDWQAHPLNPSPEADPEYALNWILLVDALNFSFWSDLEVGPGLSSGEDLRANKFGVDYKGVLYQGYWALPALINRALDAKVPLLDFNQVAKMGDSELLAVFFSEHSHIESYPPLVELRIKVVRETAQILVEKFGGSAKHLILQANRSASNLVALLALNFPSFNDVSTHLGREVAFYKRAQILVADIWACFKGQGLGHFHDIDNITMFADYRVPQTLVYLGVLKYSDTLLEKLNSDTPHLENGHRMEVEIRGNAIWGVELICQELKSIQSSDVSNRGAQVQAAPHPRLEWNAILIDFYLWEFAKFHAVTLSPIPIHRTRCCFY